MRITVHAADVDAETTLTRKLHVSTADRLVLAYDASEGVPWGFLSRSREWAMGIDMSAAEREGRLSS